MASSKEALRRQRRRELDARRSKSRVRLGPCVLRWGQLKDSLGFTLHSELAQYLLESYLSKSCSREESAIMASVEGLHRLVLLVHLHGQRCPHLPTLQQGFATAGSDPCPGQRWRAGKKSELGTKDSSGSENGPSSTRDGLMESTKALDGERSLNYVCENGHVLSWCPTTPGSEGGEGGGETDGGLSLTAGPPRETAQGGAGEVVRGGADGGSGMRTRRRNGLRQTETPRETPQGAEEETGEQDRSSPTPGTHNTREGSAQVGPETGNDVVPTGSPQSSQECDPATSPEASTEPQKSTEHSDRSRQTAQPGWRRNRTSLANYDVPLFGGKRKRKANPREILQCTYEGCEKIFSSRQYLNHHMKYQHVQRKTFTCSHPPCGKSFNFKKHLKEHQKLHSNQRDYICEFCARAFRTSSNLLIHRRIHTGEKPLQCEVCGFTCCQKASLNWHMKKHNAESSYQFPCDICGRRFEKRDNVSAHRGKSHPEHPVNASSALPASTASVAPSPSVPACPERMANTQSD
ncbi:zinc finger protein 692 isoform X2 [Clupea harengus]|uniref:Zinc finger protein 692 isoform X2 n=1 Tax=Clupea harengus TaxID=7950 RepID=A0A6P8G3T6_CLUHA|nr:zinc finger protein 692 isoform X2 [Clupea harengus]